MNSYGENGGNGGNGSDGGAFDDDFDELIRDPEYDFDEPVPGAGFGWEDPAAAFRGHGSRGSGSAHGGSTHGGSAHGDRSAADSIARLIELVGSLATEALPADTRRQFESMLRDLLVVLRDTIDRLIDRLDEHGVDDEVEIEEIRID